MVTVPQGNREHRGRKMQGKPWGISAFRGVGVSPKKTHTKRAFTQTSRWGDPQGTAWGANLISDLQTFVADSLEDIFYIVIRYSYIQA